MALNSDNIRPNMDVLKQLIAIVKRARKADKIYMVSFQVGRDATCMTEASLHSCGNRACFAGYVALSPEWKAYGGGVNPVGKPTYPATQIYDIEPCQNVGQWLGVSSQCLNMLFYSVSVDGNFHYTDFHVVYNKPWEDVNSGDVLKVLNRVKRAGSFSPILKQAIKKLDVPHASRDLKQRAAEYKRLLQLDSEQ